MRSDRASFVLALAALVALATAAGAVDRGLSLLILDLDGDGLRLSDIHYPIFFDIDGDEQRELVSWTAAGQREAILWLDWNDNGLPDDGRELFTAFSHAWGDGATTEPAFRLLQRYDLRLLGGNGDGSLSRDDLAWSSLRLWLDLDHDGIASRAEISTLDAEGVERITLAFSESHVIDGNLNCIRAAAPVAMRKNGPGHRRQPGETTLAEVHLDFAPAPVTAQR